MTAVWQQIFALDARYNANRASNHPNFRTLYIRRRNQLLRELSQNSETDPNFRKQYLKQRSLLLQQRYGVTSGSISLDQISIKSRSYKNKNICDSPDSIKEEKSADKIETLVDKTLQSSTVGEDYAFVGVHHIFDQHTSAVTMLKFANNDRTLLCCISDDTKVSICNVADSPPYVSFVLQGHTAAVTGCDWSLSNDSVVTCSKDKTLRLWNVSDGFCLRVVKDEMNCEVLCCIFQPANNNIVFSGNSKGYVTVLNVSTGIYPKSGSSKAGGRILSLTCDTDGRHIWCGSDKGVITSFMYDQSACKLTRLKKLTVVDNCPVTCLSWRSWINKEARNPTLLVNCASNVVCLYRVADNTCELQLKRKFMVRHKYELIRSTFCPIMSFRQGTCVVTGSEDSCVYFLDIEKEIKPVVNKLQGHSCPVLGVSFNYDESLLATSDTQGLIIIWKRGDASAVVIK